MLSRIALSSLVLSFILSHACDAATRAPGLRGGVAPRKLPGAGASIRPGATVDAGAGAAVSGPAIGAGAGASAHVTIAAPADLTLRPAIRPAIARFGDHASEVAREKGRLLREAAAAGRTGLRANARTDAHLAGRAAAPGLAVRDQVHARNDASARVRAEAHAADRAKRLAEHADDAEERAHDAAEKVESRAEARARKYRGKRADVKASLSARAAASMELPDVGF